MSIRLNFDPRTKDIIVAVVESNNSGYSYVLPKAWSVQAIEKHLREMEAMLA